MKLLKLSLAAAVAALVVGTGTVARANLVTDGTYVFTATDGDTPLNGSSVTFLSDAIVSWNMLDSLAASYDPYPPTDIPLTPSNSFISGFGLYGPDQWYFIIDGNNFSGANYYDQFKGQNNLFGPGVGGGFGSLYDGFGDPDGNWTLSGSTSVPDTAGTFQLFVCAVIALGTCKYFLRGRAACRR
jgi:hypothetical protein